MIQWIKKLADRLRGRATREQGEADALGAFAAAIHRLAQEMRICECAVADGTFKHSGELDAMCLLSIEASIAARGGDAEACDRACEALRRGREKFEARRRREAMMDEEAAEAAGRDSQDHPNG